MQISRALKKSKRGSIHLHRRLSIILILALIVIVIALVAFQEVPQLSVAGNPGDAPGTDPFGDDSGSGTYSTLESTPEFGFGGGALALVICFIAFGLFMKRGKLKASIQ
jgi:hypothetical protein